MKIRLALAPASWRLAALALAVLLASPSFAVAQPPLPPAVVETLPEKPPAWVAGYQLRYALRCVQDVTRVPTQSIVARLPTGGWLRADGADVAVPAADGTMIPANVVSHSALGETLIQFARHGNDQWYWAYAANPQAAAAAGPAIAEGLVMEARDWAGGDFSSWTAVRDALTKSGPVLASCFTAEIAQRASPIRPAVPRNYAVTYRGTLNIKTDGVYRFFVNSEDASFLFIDGFKVCDRPGQNARVRGTIPTKSIGNDIELKAGPHAIEVHHVLGENTDTYGGCLLLWAPPGAKTWTVCPREQFPQPHFAHVANLEAQGPLTAAVAEYGIDDVLVTAGGASLHLVRFAATGDLPADEKAIAWDFGDGTKGTGRSPRHVYFAPGDYEVTLSTGGPLTYRRRVHVWAAPGAISPFTPQNVMETLRAADWRSLPGERQDQILDFLVTCDEPARWSFVADLARHRLKAPNLDAQLRARLVRSLIEAVGHVGKPPELQPIVADARKEFAKLPTLLVGIDLEEAEAFLRRYNDPDEAATRYEAALDRHRRLEHPDVRRLAIGYGDLLAERGDMKAASEMYKTAATLGGEAFLATAQSEAVTRGALLRLAEQKLRTGDILETRALLARIELNYPDQKLEGLYRFLRAESDRHAGRYEEALRSYELLMELRQWAGYRDRAMHGIADCHARMDHVDLALEWLAKTDKAFPAFYEKQGLPAKRLALVARQEFLKSQSKVGEGAKPPPVADFATNFEPDELHPIGKSATIRIVPGLGLAGPHVGLMESHPIYVGYMTLERPVEGYSPGGKYWVECWHREDMYSLFAGFNAHQYLYLYGGGTQVHPTSGQGTYFIERSTGAWRKAGFVLEPPAGAGAGRFVTSSLVVGAIQIDGLSVRKVTDRQFDALSSFIDRTHEGAGP